MAIEFHCDHCGKFLSTDESKAGRQAKCPGCGELVTVPQPAVRDAADDSEDATPTTAPAGRSRPCPMCGADVPVGEKTCPACGEELGAARSGTEPGGPVTIETGDVISTAWEITKRNLGFLIALTIIMGVINVLASMPGQIMATMGQMQNQQNGDATLIILGNLWQIPANLFSVFVTCGQTMILLKLARGEAASLGELFGGGRFFLRMLICSIVFGLVVFLGILCCIIPGIYLSLAMWPFAAVLVAEDLNGLDPLQRAWKLTTGNRLTLLVIGFASTGILILGALALCVGLLVALPLVAMIPIVAYLRMSGQMTVIEAEAV